MTECDNAEVRDLLPDYVAETLAGAEHVRVQEHVSSCDACEDEVGLLRAMLAARPVARPVDVARIVSALPRPAVGGPALRLVQPDAPLARRRVSSAPLWRMAAAVGVAALGGWGVLSNRAGVGSADAASVQVATSTSLSGDTLRNPASSDAGQSSMTVAAADTPRAGGSAASRTARNAVPTNSTLSLGDLSDYSDDDLQRMLDQLDKWDGATSADPIPTVPIIPVTERGTR